MEVGVVCPLNPREGNDYDPSYLYPHRFGSPLFSSSTSHPAPSHDPNWTRLVVLLPPSLSTHSFRPYPRQCPSTNVLPSTTLDSYTKEKDVCLRRSHSSLYYVLVTVVLS